MHPDGEPASQTHHGSQNHRPDGSGSWEQGFERYEISNYAKNGQYSKHNLVYWQYQPYAAFGAAACGFDGASRFTAKEVVEDYIAQVGNDTIYNEENLSKQELLGEFMFMGLRKSSGVNLKEARACICSRWTSNS